MPKTPTLDADILRRFVSREARIWGTRVKARRKALGLTLEQVAEKAWTTPQTVHKVETGEIVARDHVRLAIAFALAVEHDELFSLPKRDAIMREVA